MVSIYGLWFYCIAATCAARRVADRATAAFVIVEADMRGLVRRKSGVQMPEYGPEEAGP